MAKKILVVGDSISDIYRSFQHIKQCPDAPKTPVGILTNIDVRPGGAANVAVNLDALLPSDCSISLISVIDQDCVNSLKRVSRINMAKCLFVSANKSLRKERVILSGKTDEFVARLDNRSSIDHSDSESISQSVRNYLRSGDFPDLIILSDYNGGILTDRLMTELEPVKDRLLVDTKKKDLRCFRGSLFAKLNDVEYRDVLLTDAIPEEYFKYFVVTSGASGARLLIRTKYKDQPFGSICTTYHFRGHKVEAVDSCGCGDTFLAGLAAGMIRYSDPFEAVSFANAASSTVVTQPRTAVADLKETLRLIGREV